MRPDSFNGGRLVIVVVTPLCEISSVRIFATAAGSAKLSNVVVVVIV